MDNVDIFLIAWFGLGFIFDVALCLYDKHTINAGIKKHHQFTEAAGDPKRVTFLHCVRLYPVIVHALFVCLPVSMIGVIYLVVTDKRR